MNLILLKLFIAIICEAYEDIKKQDKMLVNSDLIDYFNNIWA